MIDKFISELINKHPNSKNKYSSLIQNLHNKDALVCALWIAGAISIVALCLLTHGKQGLSRVCSHMCPGIDS